MAQLPKEVVWSPSLGVFQSHGDVALGDVVSEHGRGGLRLGSMILVIFTNLYDSNLVVHVGTCLLEFGITRGVVFPKCPRMCDI